MKLPPKRIILGPRQQFTGSNGLRYKLVSKKKAWEIIKGAA